MGCCFFNTQCNLPFPSYLPNFKIVSQVVPEKSVTGCFPIHYKGVSDGKSKDKKKALAYLCSYIQYTWSSCRCIQNLKKLAQLGAEKSVTQFFSERKKNGQNRVTDKQYVADSLIHITSCHT